jgi:hypothetical protein
MMTDPVQLPDVAGPVAVKYDLWWGRHAVVVDGVKVPKVGRNEFDLPTTTGGTVRARLKTSWIKPFPTLVLRDQAYPLGPDTPAYLTVLTMLPVLGVLGGLLGIVVGFAAITANTGIVRTGLANGLKALALLGVFAVAVVIYLLIVTVIYANA